MGHSVKLVLAVVALMPFLALAGADEDLYHAAALGDDEACKIALARHANPNYVDRRTGQTPLWNAVIGNHERVVRLLLQAGAAATIPVTRVAIVDEPSESHHEETPVLTSSARPRSQSVPSIPQPELQRRNSVSGAKTEESPRNGSPRTPRRITIRLETLLRVSPRKKEKETASSFLELPALPLCDELRAQSDSAIEKKNTTEPAVAPSIACPSATPPTPRSQASSRTTPRQVVLFMRLPIHEATERGLIDIVKLLLPHHNDDVISEKDNTGATLGDIALRAGHMPIYHLLREHENRALLAMIRRMITPIHVAVRGNDYELVELILTRSNQLVDTLDRRANSPIEVALQLGHNQIAALLVVQGAQMPEGFVDQLPMFPFVLRNFAQSYPTMARSLLQEMRREAVRDADVPRWLMSRLDAKDAS